MPHPTRRQPAPANRQPRRYRATRLVVPMRSLDRNAESVGVIPLEAPQQQSKSPWVVASITALESVVDPTGTPMARNWLCSTVAWLRGARVDDQAAFWRCPSPQPPSDWGEAGFLQQTSGFPDHSRFHIRRAGSASSVDGAAQRPDCPARPGRSKSAACPRRETRGVRWPRRTRAADIEAEVDQAAEDSL